MSPLLTALISLQSIESDADNARKAIEELPARKTALEASIATAEQQLADAKTRLAENQNTRRSIDKDLAAVQGRLSKYKDQLMAVKTNKEYTAMQHEIATASGDVQQFEDHLLAVMLESDELTEAVKVAERFLAETRKSATAAIDALAGDKVALEERIAEAARARADLVRDIAPQTVALFDFVRARRQTAVVEAKDGHCTVCHVRLRPQVFNLIRTNEQVVQCDSCQRILFFVPPPPKPADAPAKPEASASPEPPAD